MKLYKYVSSNALKGILESGRLGFTHPRDFNDPFDQPYVLRTDPPPEIPIFGESQTSEQIAKGWEIYWGDCAVASFTRTSDNALMWAHYADSHRGVVIEFDAEKADLTHRGFTIPVQFGSVIYLKRPNRSRQTWFQPEEKSADRFNIDNYETLQRLFLTKPLDWAYEEEVRAVIQTRDLYLTWHSAEESPDGGWKKIRHPTQPNRVQHGFRLEDGAISSVYAGLHFTEVEWLAGEAKRLGFAIMKTSKNSDEYGLTFEPCAT